MSRWINPFTGWLVGGAIAVGISFFLPHTDVGAILGGLLGTVGSVGGMAVGFIVREARIDREFYADLERRYPGYRREAA